MQEQEPLIIDDDICDLCGEDAMPYEFHTEFPWCVTHWLQMWTACGIEDFEIDAEGEYQWESFKSKRGFLNYGDACYGMSFDRDDPTCDGIVAARIKDANQCPNLLMQTADLCPVHSMCRFGPEAPLTSREWLEQCQPGYKEEDQDLD